MKNINQKTVRKSAIVAASALLGMAVLAPIAYFGILGSLVVEGEVIQTARNVADSLPLFIFGIICLIVVVVLDVVVALALYRFLAPINRGISKLTAALRIVYAVIFMGAITSLIMAALMANEGHAQNAQSITDSITMYGTVWDVALLVFAAHLILLGWLFYAGKYTPTWLGVLLVIAGLGYGIDSIGLLFIPGYAIEIATVAFVGEVALIFWLFIKGRKVSIKT